MLFGNFMMGAKSRLLPPSLPFRFFGAAVVFHVLAWALLLGWGNDLPGFLGGPGHVLAALHMITLGVLTMTAMGASFQLLPVATKRPLRSVRACKAAFWLLLLGVLGLTHGMGHDDLWAMEGGGSLVVAALTIYFALVVDNLRRVGDMRLVTDHTWLAIACLVVLAGLGATLIGDFATGFLPDHGAIAIAHGVIAAYGFMGMLVLGFSFILVPLFALAPPPDEKLGRRATLSAAVALLLALIGLTARLSPLVFLAGAVGLLAAGLHLAAMAKLMKARMRRKLGDSFLLIRLAWVLLPLTILLGMTVEAGLVIDRSGPLFGFLLVFGWLLSFLLGVMQRIMPFLASMHSIRPGIKPALVSALTADRPLRVHLIGHVAGLSLVAAGIVLAVPLLVRLGAACGLVGAVAFLIFAVTLWRRMHLHLNPAEIQ